MCQLPRQRGLGAHTAPRPRGDARRSSPSSASPRPATSTAAIERDSVDVVLNHADALLPQRSHAAVVANDDGRTDLRESGIPTKTRATPGLVDRLGRVIPPDSEDRQHVDRLRANGPHNYTDADHNVAGLLAERYGVNVDDETNLDDNLPTTSQPSLEHLEDEQGILATQESDRGAGSLRESRVSLSDYGEQLAGPMPDREPSWQECGVGGPGIPTKTPA